MCASMAGAARPGLPLIAILYAAITASSTAVTTPAAAPNSAAAPPHAVTLTGSDPPLRNLMHDPPWPGRLPGAIFS